ncbi:MAG: O-antigen ligase family protein [Chthoniobacterales bacterium]
MVAGTQDAWAIAAFLVFGGLALVLARPSVRPSAVPLLLIPLFACLALAAFLPQSYFPIPEWRSSLMDLGAIPLADSVNPQPWLGWFWWWLLAATCLVGAALLTAPLETKPLALVLQAAALFVAIYASLSIFALQTGWKYPFHGGAVFGFLPNRNHTATLLVVGSVLSFGLMQWRLARGDKAAAAFAALCGAPSLAALLFFSTSRAGVVFLVVGLAVWAVGASRSPGMRKRILSAVLALIVFAGLLFVFGGSTVRDRLSLLWTEAVSVQLEGGGEDVDFRQPVFRDTTRMIRDFPLSGTGLGQFRYVFPQYRSDSARAANVLHPESDWLMVAAETGLPSALVLAALLVWFVFVCWRSRSASGGMLRWTAASAILAAALHGVIDVPWHRVSVGWFLLAIAASSVPSSGHSARVPGLSRFLFIVGGLAMIAAAGWIGHDKREGFDPAPYRWAQVSKELERLGNERNYEEAERAAQKAVRQFPLVYESYYWLASYLRAFEETAPEINAAVRAGRAVEPVLPKVAEEQAVILQPVDPDGALQAWVVAVNRATAIDAKEKRTNLSSAGNSIARSLAAFKDDSERQLQLARELADRPILAAHWINQADKDAAASFLPGIADEAQFLDALPPELRRQVLSKWILVPDSARAVEFMEQREAVSSGGEYWPVLARHYAAQGDLPRAVRRVASSNAVSLDAPRSGDTGLRGEMAHVSSQGNPVAARRMAKEAIDAKEADLEDLSAAMAYFASQNDWESAWKAASRLATEAKIGH